MVALGYFFIFLDAWVGIRKLRGCGSPRCTITFQDLKDSGRLVFQDALRFQKVILQAVLIFHHSSNIIKTDPKSIQVFIKEAVQFRAIYLGIKLSKNSSGFQKIIESQPSYFPVFIQNDRD